MQNASSCLFVYVKQLDTQLMNFHEIWYLSISRKSVEKIQASLKYDKNDEYCIWSSMYIYDNISPNS